MKKIIKYEFLVWLLISIELFFLVLPIQVNFMVKILAGYLFYFLIKETFHVYTKQTSTIMEHIGSITRRIARLPHKTTVFVHRQVGESDDKKKKVDVRKYL